MPLQILVFYGSYRRDRAGIRLARYLTEAFAARGHAVELYDPARQARYHGVVFSKAYKAEDQALAARRRSAKA